jgi:phenylalanyl-tRNA synthetase alpha chain
MSELSANEKKVLGTLRRLRRCAPEQLVEACGFRELVEVMSAVSWLRTKGLVSIEERVVREYALGKEGREYLAKGLPERRVLAVFGKRDAVALEELFEELGKRVAGIAVGHLRKLGVSVEGGFLKVRARRVLEARLRVREKILAAVARGEKLEGFDAAEVQALTRRGEVLLMKEKVVRSLAREVKDIFVSMGFREIEYDFVQPCFWNMDALFVPQDHPARDMQDSFYLGRRVRLRKDCVGKVKAVHERCWHYRWSTAEAEQLILRTHTTVNTIRYLAEHYEKGKPCKVFSVGRTFRRERVDATHLPEFIQIEGIAAERGASFNTLIGILKEFYRRLGFPKISFKPSFFPFTEPSLEVIVDWRGKTFELGGAGIFRPEVTETLGVDVPVLAWGLGLERLAMLRWGISDIRRFYMTDLKWLRELKTVGI